MKHCLAISAVLALPSVSLAQEQLPPPPVVGNICAVLGGLLILVLLAVLVVVVVQWMLVVRRSGAMRGREVQTKLADHIELANAHIEDTKTYMKRQEEREKRMIELLESIEWELKRNRSEDIKKP
jgi:predicted Holliday junction resolvase-like endonuclease